MAGTDKVRENRLRRMAARQGLRLARSPRRDTRALDYGKYALADEGTDIEDIRHDGYSLDLDAVERILTEEK